MFAFALEVFHSETHDEMATKGKDAHNCWAPTGQQHETDTLWEGEKEEKEGKNKWKTSEHLSK